MAITISNSQLELYAAGSKGNIYKCAISKLDGSLNNCNDIGNVGVSDPPINIAIWN